MRFIVATLLVAVSVSPIHASSQSQNIFEFRAQKESSLQQLQESIVQVFVTNARYDICRPFSLPKETHNLGSAFFVDPSLIGYKEGYLLTNFHVVKNARFIEIQIPSNRCGKERFEVFVQSIYPERDLALICLTQESLARLKKRIGTISCLPLGNSQALQRGDLVVAAGFPLGQQGLKVTRGIMSGRERLHAQGELYLQVDAAVNRGNSGGPSLNKYGEVIGINTCGPHPAYHPGVQNIAYLIPIDYVRSLLPIMMTQKRLYNPFWAIYLSAGSDTISKLFNAKHNVGAYVAAVHEDGILYKYGIRPGMLLTKINGYDIDYYGELTVPWAFDKISVLDFLNSIESNKHIELELLSQEGSHYIRFEIDIHTLFNNPAPIWPQTIYPSYDSEKMDYECLGGLVFMEYVANHMKHFSIQEPNDFTQQTFGESCIRKPRNKEPKNHIVLSALLSNTLAARSRSLRPGLIISHINGEEVHSLADVRQALLQSKQTGMLIVQGSDGSLMILQMHEILLQEKILMHEYGYAPSVVCL